MTVKLTKAVLAASVAAGLFAACNSSAGANDWNQSTEITFNNPVQIPGNRVLQAGTYWMKVMDHDAIPMSDVVVIYNQDRSQVEAMLMTKSVESITPAPDTELTFAEQGKGGPEALFSWFYPGENIGHEFLYSNAHQHQLDESQKVTLSLPGY